VATSGHRRQAGKMAGEAGGREAGRGRGRGGRQCSVCGAEWRRKTVQEEDEVQNLMLVRHMQQERYTAK